MSVRCRGARAAGVTLIIAFLLTNYFQPIFSGCKGNCSPTQAMSTQRGCSADSVTVTTVSELANRTTVQWTIRESACEVQDVTVRYKAYQKKACGNSSRTLNRRYVKVREGNIVANTADISGLEPYTSYNIQIKLTFTNTGRGTSIQQIITTTASAPRVVENVHGLSITNSTSLQFVWDPLTCNNINGIFDYYSAELSRGNSNDDVHHQILDAISSSSVTFTALDPCTTYTVTVVAVNRNPLAFGRQSTAVSAETKAKVMSAAVDPNVSGSLSVRWNIHTRCRRTELTYNFTYQLVQLEACPWGHGGASQNRIFSSNDSSNMFTIHDLRPFATYRIWISIDGVGDGAYPNDLTGTTLPSDPGGVRGLLHTQIDDGFSFSWGRPDCADLHGSSPCFNYRLMRDNNEKIVDKRDCTQVTQKTYMMNKLQVCTVYRFQVQVVTRSYLQWKESGWKTVNAQTPTQAPGVPRNVHISQESDTVTWEAPTDLPCEPEGYYVTHKLLYKDMCEIPSNATKEKRIDDVDSPLMRKTIQGLFSYSQYQVCVRGTNAGGDGEPTCVNFTTGHEAPSKPPKKLQCSDQSYGSLTFTWNKPRCGNRNGPISHYEYILNAGVSNVSILGSVNASENGGDITFTNLIPATIYVFRVRANNDNLSGSYGPAVEAHTSPPIYRPPRKVVVTSWNETTAVIEWLAPDSSVFNTIGYTIACWQSGLQENTSIFVSYDAEVCASTCLMEAAITGLKPATNHSIQVTAVYKYGEEKSHVLQFQTPEEVRESSSRKAVMLPVLVCMFLLIFVLLLVIASLLYSRKTNRPLFNPERLSFSVQGILNALRRTGTALNKSVPMSSSRNRDHTEQELNGGGLEMEITCRVSETNNHGYNREMESNMSSEIYANMPAQDTKHGAIPVGQLLGYMARRNADGSNSLDDDFKSLPSQKLHPQYIALKAENKEKNRFINILPYDNARVNLTVVHGDPHSDYINASFIDGYRTPKKYIAAQGPNKASVDDFWRMMWQYDCRKIVMLTNLRESNKKKCEQYWPTESVAYGGIWVSMTNEKKSDHYTVRYLNLVCNNTGRDVVQYHYTTWPDMGVPEYPSHLMNFIKITREPLKSPKGPTVVHCSAGVGRTGTFLTLDAMLDQIETEQAVHIHAFIVQMRQKRPNMVQTKKQYRFIYEALLQELTCGDTSIPRNAFGETCQSLLSKSNGVTGIQRQFELLEALTILPQDEETAAARSKDNASKNRFPDKVPVSRTRPFLMTEVEGGNDYINASFLPGYVTRNQFIGTQTPLPNTVVDFWRLVVDYKVETIVMLHGNTKDKKYSQYWPTEGSQRYGPFKIDVKKEEYKRPIMHRTFEVTKTDSKKAFPKTVKQLQLASCPPPLDVPPTLTDVIDLYRALLTALGSTEWKEGDSPLLVHCRDGEGMTGAFCAFLAVMDQLNAKQTIDVFHACKKLRTTRPGAVASLAQYQFIYEAVKSHLISSTIYENVTKKI